MPPPSVPAAQGWSWGTSGWEKERGEVREWEEGGKFSNPHLSRSDVEPGSWGREGSGSGEEDRGRGTKAHGEMDPSISSTVRDPRHVGRHTCVVEDL